MKQTVSPAHGGDGDGRLAGGRAATQPPATGNRQLHGSDATMVPAGADCAMGDDGMGGHITALP
ncbi:hypothetical protein [Sphingobium sp. MK2]|uniref:hypothetical protein n=1 Tax=Sphingobium sp. MK2 TaxID=3116540 RepID=UPI0032E365FA